MEVNADYKTFAADSHYCQTTASPGIWKKRTQIVLFG